MPRRERSVRARNEITENVRVRGLEKGEAVGELGGKIGSLVFQYDAAPGDVQRQPAQGGSIPIHGGTGDPNGEFNAIYTHFTAGQGFSAPYTGSSFVQVVSWNSGPCPLGGTILTYSESDNPTSPHHSDQTRLFSRKQWVPDTFCPSAIKRDTKSTMVLERGR